MIGSSSQWLVEISWMFKGNTHAIRKLTLTLIGKEKASYRQGTSTRTEESTFFKQVIIETEDPTTIAKGFELVQLPQDAMHSFKSDNNEIVWLVQTDGDVAWWPDLDDAFPFRVPARGNQTWSLQLPRGPLSLNGHLIRIQWTLHCRADGREMTPIPLTISPTRRPIQLTPIAT